MFQTEYPKKLALVALVVLVGQPGFTRYLKGGKALSRGIRQRVKAKQTVV
jgi:hypothetical protein